ncbi:serine hydrolase domain-containing protein [Thalassotalea litorea]|uniref:serine hydrolase domain-containing protein n=1 Tax=Thalassotalea litorea TaxID=2020715 RepID=UPI0014853527|nr:serine hydrolase domain-containing protein [Thalassotalea litorea]
MIIRNFILAFVLAYSTASVAKELKTKDIDAIFSEFDGNVPGCSVTVSQNGKTTFDKGFGLSNLEYGIPITSDNRFLIGSTSKQFTAYSIALLVQKGKIKLSDSLWKFFPKFPDYAQSILVSDLIHHTSGIRDIDHLTYLGGFGESIDYTDSDAMSFLVRQEALNFNPGTDYMYSNSNYFLLAKIIEVVTNKSFREFTTENIFEPLGMHHSYFNDDHTEVIKLRASGYWPSDKGYALAFNTMDIVGASGLYTTNKDLQIWFSNFMEEPLGSDSKSLFQELVKVGRYRNNERLHYAYGLEVDRFNGLYRVHHGGGDAGYRAMSMMFPEEKTAFSILCNNGYVNTMNLAQKLTKVIFSVREESTLSVNKYTPVNPKEIVNLLGDYWSDALKQKVSLIEDDGTVFYQINSRSKHVLYRIDDLTNSFNVYLSNGVPTHIIPNSEDTITVMTMRHGLKQSVKYEKISRSVKSLSSNISGKYYSLELDSYYQLAATRSGLILHMAGSGPHKLTTVKKGVFTDEYGQIVITFDSHGDFLLSSSRAKNIAFKQVGT